jgi:hypothetical protein
VIGSTTVVTGANGQAASAAPVGTTSSTSTATCAPGTKLLGGGATVTQPGNAKGAVSMSAPVGATTPTGWQATAVVTISGTGAVQITAFAICGS